MRSIWYVPEHVPHALMMTVATHINTNQYIISLWLGKDKGAIYMCASASGMVREAGVITALRLLRGMGVNYGRILIFSSKKLIYFTNSIFILLELNYF